MAEPRDYRIATHLQAALQGIATAAGYHHTLAALAVKLDPNHEVDALLHQQALRPFVILEWLPDRFEYFAAGEVRVVTPVHIHAVGDADLRFDEARHQAFCRLCADVERAIALDPTRGGLATDTVIRSREFHGAPDGAQVWAIVKTEVRVHRTYGAPN